MQAATIDEVIDFLTQIIQENKATNNALGYFPALYRMVTEAVKEGIAKGEFEDGPRMEKLDVVFANRYLAAYTAYQAGQPCSACWQLAFEDAKRPKILVIQHLLLGMNAHINLDLGLAAAEVCPGDQLPALENDFKKINDILLALTSIVQDELTRINPLMRYVKRYLGDASVKFVGFSMSVARWFAWHTAEEFADIPQAKWPKPLHDKDDEVTKLGDLLTPNGPLLRGILKAVRRKELKPVGKAIACLEGLKPSLSDIQARATTMQANMPV